MANADRKHVGVGPHGKGSGGGAMSDLKPETVEENTILSNRDKQRRSKERGQDSKGIQSEQHGDE
ncbi:hypothetical protein SAMN06265338_101224 [Rhodoblastus acidophilus]|uniref:Uncharacterized protein n=1 Tax=Rhodoblastus acidophilus TaxID=1074 RepID=A0A212PYW8_RHOAC|nr:hypothetical protein [Rhodoblastus acidophilus]MCW2318165.1 hypothetical protein [Rhodoblastus acidophilus]PPQ38694.1 hypothetical protein CKO16_08745 [Rhodoblastus acidophilus]RAI21149.1 hypothetical protein CH337_07925 [Rhodoblastus acidophilus]SNB52295.1 hypothetical protein SAMN06265338_101224 [Rhodoblastus acidophilus]